jgi:hypothetical protein
VRDDAWGYQAANRSNFPEEHLDDVDKARIVDLGRYHHVESLLGYSIRRPQGVGPRGGGSSCNIF